MVSTAGAMKSLQRSLNVVQNNIVNASTVGYARQEGSLIANPFNPNSTSTSGGVTFGPIASSRDAFVEAAVWKTQHRSGYADSLSTKLTEIERTFPIAAGSGVSGEIDKFFATISQWSVSPNDSVARRQVLNRAASLSQSFNKTAIDLGDAAGRAGTEIGSTVQKINRLTADIVSLNKRTVHRAMEFKGVRTATRAGLRCTALKISRMIYTAACGASANRAPTARPRTSIASTSCCCRGSPSRRAASGLVTAAASMTG